MDEQKCIIQCDECKNVFDIRNMNIKTIENLKFADKTFTATYFKCEQCGKIYIVELLDYKAEKMKNRYLSIAESIQKKRNKGLKVSEARMHELEKSKQNAINYQHWLVDNYKIPLVLLEGGKV